MLPLPNWCLVSGHNCVYASKIADTTGSGALKQNWSAARSTRDLSTSSSKIYEIGPSIWPGQAGLLKPSEGYPLRYYSSSSWVSAVEEADAPPPQESPTVTSAQLDSRGAAPSPPSSDKSKADLSIYDFASTAGVNKGVCYFTEYVQFFYPVVDIQGVTGALHQHARGQTSLSQEMSALVAAMCYGAYSTMILADQYDSSDVDPAVWRELGHRFLFASGYPLRPNMDSVRAAFLLSASSMTEWSFLPDPTPISVLIRAAQSIGLHRDPTSFQFSPREAGFRRRLWWCIHSVDVGYSLAHALPPAIHASNADVRPIEDEVDPELRLLTFLIRISRAIYRILEHVYGIRRPEGSTIKQLDQDIAEQSRLIRQRPPGTTPQDRFTDLSVRMCWNKTMFLLHQPYLRSDSWPKESRNKALSGASGYIRDYADAITDPSLAQHRWMLSHWNMFHAIAVILQDLIQHPHSSESAELLELIDSTFNDFSKSFDHNWQKVQLLRTRAWNANQWSAGKNSDDIHLDVPDTDASLGDWDPLFASFVWDNATLDFDFSNDLT